MIDTKDIELYLKAKKEQLAIDIFQILSALALAILIALEAMGIEHDYTILLATSSVVFMTVAIGGGRWVSVSRGKLISLIGRVINSDADALTKLAAIKNG